MLRSFGWKMLRVAIIIGIIAVGSVVGQHRAHNYRVQAQRQADFDVWVQQIEYQRQAWVFEQRLNEYSRVLHCTPSNGWRQVHPGKWDLPASMVVQPVRGGLPTWELTVSPWSFKGIGGYVKLLCVQPFWVADGRM